MDMLLQQDENRFWENLPQLAKGPFGSNMHKDGVLDLFNGLLKMEGATLDKIIQLVKGNFGSNMHKAEAQTQLQVLCEKNFSFDELVALLATQFGSLLHKDLGQQLLNDTLGHLKHLQVPDTKINFMACKLLSTKLHCGHVNVRELTTKCLNNCRVQNSQDIELLQQLIRSNFNKKDKDSNNFVSSLFTVWDKARKAVTPKLPKLSQMQRALHKQENVEEKPTNLTDAHMKTEGKTIPNKIVKKRHLQNPNKTDIGETQEPIKKKAKLDCSSSSNSSSSSSSGSS